MPKPEAQEVSFRDSVDLYNKQRIKINRTGSEVLGVWGIASMAEGAAGYFGAKEGEAKYFSEMNGIFGVINTGLAATGLLMAQKQMARKLNYERSYDRYLTDKKIYLAGAGLDIVYIGVGFGLASYGAKTKNNAFEYTGFGKSIVLQGVFLLLFDNFMLLSHQRNSNKWYRIIDEIRITNNGIGFVHVLN